MFVLRKRPAEALWPGLKAGLTTTTLEKIVMAEHRLPQIPTISITTASVILAQLRARQHVKRQLQAKGEKVTHYSARDISVLANQYLADHRAELIPPAIEQARAMILSGAMGKRAATAFKEELKIEQSQVERSVANG
jgi:hypothetical protein